VRLAGATHRLNRPGKQGKGSIPVDREKLANRKGRRRNRVFAYLRLDTKPTRSRERWPSRHGEKTVCRSSHLRTIPTISAGFFPLLKSPPAVAGSILASIPSINHMWKQANRDAQLTSEYEKTGSLPRIPFLRDRGIKLITLTRKIPRALKSRRPCGRAETFHRDRINCERLFPFSRTHNKPANEDAAPGHSDRWSAHEKKAATVLGFVRVFLHPVRKRTRAGWGRPAEFSLQITWRRQNRLAGPDRSNTFSVGESRAARGDFRCTVVARRRALRVFTYVKT